MLYNRSSSVVALALLFAFAIAPRPTAAFFGTNPILAQSASPTFPLPNTVAEGTTVRIDGSNSMAAVNQSVKQRFEDQYAGTNVEIDYNGSTAALQSLLDGAVDLVAIGRPLTNTEKAQGLTEVPVGCSKIAIIVGEENSFDGNLTFDQFAQIFRGEITDWSEVGGEPGPIRLIDHPQDSDTRQAFPRYPVFQNAPFETGTTAVQLTEDSADAIVSELGADGISYIAANQAVDRPGVRIIPMHQTLPTDPRYPYSQPLLYVYQGEPSPAVAAFLGFLTDSAGLDAVEASGAGTIALLDPIIPAAAPLDATSPSPDAPVAATPEPETTPTADPVAPTDATGGTSNTAGVTDDRGVNPWWLWLLPLLGIPLLWWLLRGRRGTRVEELPPPVSPAEGTTPPEPTLAERAGTVISADRSSIQEPIPPIVPDPAPAIPPVDPTISPAIAPSLADAAVAGGVLAGGAALAGLAGNRRPNRIVLTPRTTTQAYAYWETPEENQAALNQQGSARYTLRILDVTDIDLEQHPPHSIQEFSCAEVDRDRHIPHLQSDRDYLAEIGYLTNSDQWHLLARSAPVRMPSVSPLPEAIPAEIPTEMPLVDTVEDTVVEEPPQVTIDPGLTAGTALAGMALADAALTEPELEPELEPTNRPNQITLTLRSPQQAYAAWEVPVENQEAARQQGGRYYTLRVVDVTGIDPDTQLPHSLQQFSCQETDSDRLVPVPRSGQNYMAEIGYLTETDDWLLLARSAPVQVAAQLIPEEIAPADFAPTLDPIALADGRQEAVEAAKFDVGQRDLRGEALTDVDATLPDLPSGYGDSQIFLLPRDPNWAYTYWDVPIAQKEAVRQQGGTRLALRFYDVTGIDADEQRPHGLQQYDCEELARDWYIPVPMSDRDYIVEIGYLTHDGQWLMMARSNPTRIPPTYPTDWLDEQFITVAWDDELQGQTLLELSPPEQQTSYRSPIYDRLLNLVKSAEEQRVAGSLFGSMQQVPEQAISSYAVSGMASGIGMMSGVGITGMSGVGVTGMSGVGISAMSGAAISTLSGIGMSGVGLVGVPGVTLSGIGMSGIGMTSVPTMSGIGMSGVGLGLTMSGVGMSGVGMSGVGMSGLSGIGMYSMSGVTGMSGVGFYSMSGVTGMSGIGLLSSSGIGMYGMSGVGMSGIGMGLTMSGVGMSGVGMYSLSGIGLSGIGMMSLQTMSGVGLSMSGIGMSGVGMYGLPTMSGAGFTMSGVGMSGVGMYGSIPTMSGIGMSGIGMSGVGMGLTMSGVGMSGVGFSASMPPIRPRKFWLIANAELIVHGATEPDATVMIGDREIKLSPDGTFRFQVAFPDGDINYPILAVASDGEQSRSIRMDFNRETPDRNTNTKAEAIEEWRREEG